ncbi:MAG TPA: hypothetical protein VIK78_19730 [Ruminiclostridium sp.]
MAGLFEQLNSKDNKKPAKSGGLFAQLNKAESSNKLTTFKEKQLEQRTPTITAKLPVQKSPIMNFMEKPLPKPQPSEKILSNNRYYADNGVDKAALAKNKAAVAKIPIVGKLINGAVDLQGKFFDSSVGRFIDRTSASIKEGLTGNKLDKPATGNNVVDTIADVGGNIFSYFAPIGGGSGAERNMISATDKAIAMAGKSKTAQSLLKFAEGKLGKAATNIGSKTLKGAAEGLGATTQEVWTKPMSYEDKKNSLLMNVGGGAGLGLLGAGIGKIASKLKSNKILGEIKPTIKPLNDLPTVKPQPNVITPTIGKEVSLMANIKPQQQIKYTTLRAPNKAVPIENVVNKVSTLRDKKPDIYYHGTNQTFDGFDSSKIGSYTGNDGLYGRGTYLTKNPVVAKSFGKNLISANVELKNPYKLNSKTSLDEIANLAESKVIKTGDQDRDLANIISQNPAKFTENLEKMGYDGVELNGGVETVVFDTTKIKKLDTKSNLSLDDVFKLPDSRFKKNEFTPSTTLQKGLIPQKGSKQIGEAQTKLITSKLKPIEKPVIKSTLKNGQLKSQFVQTVAASKNTVPQVAEGLKNLDLGYDVATNAKSLEQANARIATDTESAVRFVLDNKAPSAEHTTTAIQLINKFQKEGNYERAVDIASDISSKLTKNGQAIQAASIYDRLSPEGILLYAQRKVNKLNDERWFKGLTKEQKIDPNLAKQLQELSQNMKGLTGDAKIEASQELQQALQALGKSTLGRKVESAQTISQLLNPKTLIRNTIGNELFYRLERLNKYVATPIDVARSVITGTERTVTFKKAGQGGYWNGFFKGAKAGWKGVNPGGLQTQFDLTAPAFRGKWNPLTYMEKTLGATLKGFDYAAYTRAVNQTIGEMAELKAINLGLKGNKLAVAEFVKNTEKNILDIADQYGKYVTFQDDNVLSKGLSAVKRGLNVGKDFGAGSLIIKYPKTPGALIMRGLDYSPAGFLKSAYEVAKPLFKGGKIDTQAATMALSRAITGTLGFTGLGYYLADNGVITGRTDKDSDVRELQKQTGAGSYKVNLSALQRWALGGFHATDLQLKDDDLLYSYDWMAPIAMAVSFGANINTNLKESEGAFDNLGATVASSLEGALGTIAEQPVLQGLTRQFQGYDLGQNITQTLKGIPSSFTPTVLNQIRQLKYNTGRSTYNPDPLKESLNMAQVKIPGKSSQLPTNYDTLGKQKENYQNNSNNIFNVFLNPGFVSRNNPSPVQKEILRLYEKTGYKTHFPRVISSKLTYSIKGESNSYTFTQEEKPQYQKAVGELVQSGITKLMFNPNYKLYTDSEKVKKVYNVLNDASEKAKNDFLKRKGLK